MILLLGLLIYLSAGNMLWRITMELEKQGVVKLTRPQQRGALRIGVTLAWTVLYWAAEVAAYLDRGPSRV